MMFISDNFWLLGFGVMLAVGAFTLKGYSWGPNRAGALKYPPTMMMRIITFFFGIALIAKAVFGFLNNS